MPARKRLYKEKGLAKKKVRFEVPSPPSPTITAFPLPPPESAKLSTPPAPCKPERNAYKSNKYGVQTGCKPVSRALMMRTCDRSSLLYPTATSIEQHESDEEQDIPVEPSLVYN